MGERVLSCSANGYVLEYERFDASTVVAEEPIFGEAAIFPKVTFSREAPR